MQLESNENTNENTNSNSNIFKKLKLLPSMLANEELDFKQSQVHQKPNYDSRISNIETDIQNLNEKMNEINNRLIELCNVLQK